jgi:hypothetical protein
LHCQLPEQMKKLLLPMVAVLMAFFGISYSACQESKADAKSNGGAAKIREEITRFDLMLKELNNIQKANVESYGQQMGVSSNSTGLEVISKQNEVLEKFRMRLEYHRLQLLQADTANATRNEMQLKEIADDITQLQTEGEVVKKGLNSEPINTKVPK